MRLLRYLIAATLICVAVPAYADLTGPTVITSGTGILCTPNPLVAVGSCATTVTNNAQTGTSYAIASTDGGKIVSANNSGAQAYTIVVASTSGYGAGFGFDLDCIGTGTVTLTATTSTFDNGLNTLTCKQGQDYSIWSDGTNYHTFLSPPSMATNTLLGNAGTAGYPTAQAVGTGGLAALAAGVSGTGAICLVSGSACDTSGAGGTSGYSDNGVTVTAGTYYAPITGGGAPQSTEASVDVASPVAMTETDLQAAISATLGVSSTGFTVTLRDNGADTALTCTFNPSSVTTCSDLTHSVSVALGDLIDWKIVTAGTIVGTPTITLASSQGTSTALLATQNNWTAEQDNCVTTLTISSTTFTPNGSCNNYIIVLTSACASAACTLANWSTTRQGASGWIKVVQPASGGPAAFGTYGSQLLSPGGTATITYSTAANAIDLWSYANIDTTHTYIVPGGLAFAH